MADSKKITRKEIYKDIKKKRIIGPIIFLTVSLVALALILYYSVTGLIAYILDNKLNSEYQYIESMYKVYNKSASIDENEVYKFLDEYNRDYYIKDKEGKVIHQKGDITSSNKNEELYISGHDENVTACMDNEVDVFYTKDKNLRIKLGEILDIINDEDSYSSVVVARRKKKVDNQSVQDSAEDKPAGEDMDDLNDDEVYEINLPIWMIYRSENNDNVMYVKAIISVRERDFIIFIVVIILISLAMVTFFIAMFIRMIGNIHRQRKITNYFFKDVVTGGRNWTWFLIKGEQLLMKKNALKQKYAVVNIILQKYRNYCLCHSVEEGEKLLQNVNRIISTDIKKDEICSHSTSSNFALILKYDDVEELKKRIREWIDRIYDENTGHRFGFQTGISLIGKSVDESGKPVKRRNFNLEDEYNNACTARNTLPEAEENGIAFFDNSLLEEEKWIDLVQENQERAIRNEEFIVYYQPKYNPRTNELQGAEALIRWNSHELGFVSPGKFIPIFEKNGFITNIDHYMISHVAKDQKRWLDEGLKCVPVSVNVSRAHFVESDLAEQIRDIVDKAGTPHEYIEIELTESAFFDDKDAMIRTINKLKEYGFSVSMDDFGSGYSSLNSLKDMPLDVLKLDAEFFRGDEKNGRGKIVVSEAIKLARNLKMKTVAEGVEVKEQVDFLAGEGCDMIQGFYYAKPMPGEEYREKMSKDHSNN
ncbi:putative bifunctional diguanylate cyclase/phosphodiesterase [Eubacterium ruminantium]|uniref:putative bifunctional diguanylate cyclase/phosphodiesterase n=1 Tax=Eubacterium ruminantium TaxID=42322 RepID=UPI001568C717|nr:EAL domain-containing protein [Eubacterium ruminantium]